MRLFPGARFVLLLWAATASMPSRGAIQLDPNEEHRQGILALREGRYDDAKRLLEDLLTIVPGEHSIEYLAGRADEGLGDFQGAANHFLRALRSSPDFVPARLELGMTYLTLGRRAESERQLALLIEARNSCLEGHCSATPADFAAAIDQLTVALGEDR